MIVWARQDRGFVGDGRAFEALKKKRTKHRDVW